MAKLTRRNDEYEPHWEQVVEPTKLADGNLRVVLFGHTFETRPGDDPRTHRRLLRDGVEICRMGTFDSGMPFVFAHNFDEIAGYHRKSLTVSYSLAGAKRRP